MSTPPIVVTGVNFFFTDALQALAQHRFRDDLPVNEGPLTGELGVDSGSSLDVIGLGDDLADRHIEFVACTALCAGYCGLPFRPGGEP